MLGGEALARPDCRTKDSPLSHGPSRCGPGPGGGGSGTAAGGKPALLFPSLRRVRSFALLLPLAGSFVPVAKGTQVLPVLLGSFSHSPAARGAGEAPGPVTRSPPRGGEAGRQGGGEGGGQEPAGLDEPRWRGQDELPWKTGTAGRRSGVCEAGAGSLAEPLRVRIVLTPSPSPPTLSRGLTGCLRQQWLRF